MTNTSKTIVFFGTDEFSAVSLRALLKEGFAVGAVVTKPDSRKGRGRELSKSVVKEIAEAHDIPVFQPIKVSEIIEPLQKLTDPIGVLVSYGKIIPQAVIDLFTPGIINVHPSLLPRYRGPSPIETAIVNGDSETGVTIMQLSAAMDAGPIYSQTTIPLYGTETGPQLEADMAERGAHELTKILPAIMEGPAKLAAQDDAKATYCKLLSKDESLIDPEIMTAEQAERHVRAYLAFPKTKAIIAGQPIVITKAHVSTEASSPLDLECSDNNYLTIDELIGPSGKPMNAKAFINGYLSKK